MSRATILRAVAAGILAGIVYVFAAAQVIGGFFFVYLPVLTFCIIGLTMGSQATLVAATAATLTVGLAGIGNALFFAAMEAGPAYYLISRALLWRRAADGTTEWYPLGYPFTVLTVYSAALFTIIMLLFGGMDADILSRLSTVLEEEFKNLDSSMVASMQATLIDHAYFIFALTAWFTLLTFYGFAWLAHFLLRDKVALRRPAITIQPFDLPIWMLGLLLLSAVLSVTGSILIELIGKTTLLILIFPYFLSGLAEVHARTLSWPNRLWLLGTLYISILFFFWPAALLAAWSIYRHCRNWAERHWNSGQ